MRGLGIRQSKRPALTRRIKIVLVLVLVLVLEKWGWFGELLEYCAKSELHPHSGLEMLKGRQKRVLNMAPVRMVILDACRDNAIYQNKRRFFRAFSAGRSSSSIPRPRRLSPAAAELNSLQRFAPPNPCAESPHGWQCGLYD
jgi:hypothetical protein